MVGTNKAKSKCHCALQEPEEDREVLLTLDAVASVDPVGEETTQRPRDKVEESEGRGIFSRSASVANLV